MKKCIAICGFAFSAFLLICMVINLFKRHFVAAVCSLGACFLFFALSLLTYKKAKTATRKSIPCKSPDIRFHTKSYTL